MSDSNVLVLRKADFWTGLVLIAIAVGMLLEALTYPLEGTYAGVKNAWYVSPALFPLMIAVMLIVLSGSLLANAVRSGGAGAALRDLSRPDVGRFWAFTSNFWIIGGVFAGYIYGLLPRADFIAATTLFLFTLLALYDIAVAGAARRAFAIFVAAVLVLAFVALLGLEPAPRSAAAYWRDATVWALVAAQMILVGNAARAHEAARSRLGRCIAVSLLTPLLLGTIFKYGLLVQLPNEGLTVELLDRIRYGLF